MAVQMAKNEVGYKRPPKAFQFEPGKSGNPGGRPKKLPSMREVISVELAKRVRIADDGLTRFASSTEMTSRMLGNFISVELAKRVRIADDGLELMVSKQHALIKILVDAALGGKLTPACLPDRERGLR